MNVNLNFYLPNHNQKVDSSMLDITVPVPQRRLINDLNRDLPKYFSAQSVKNCDKLVYGQRNEFELSCITRLFRSLYKSRLLQKKITNPIYLQIVHPRELVTEVKSSEFSSNATKRKRRKEIKETEEQRVGFDLGTEPLRLSRRFTQVISDVVFKKFAWTKKATSKRSKRVRLYPNL